MSAPPDRATVLGGRTTTRRNGGRKAAAAAAAIIVAAVLAGPAPGQAADPAWDIADPAGAPAGPAELVAAADGEQATGLWTVRLTGPPLATYRGGVAGLAATNPRTTGADRLDVATAASVAYLDHLAGRQAQFVQALERQLGRSVEVVHAYRHVVNGLAVRISEPEAAAVTSLPGVVAVHQDVVREQQTDRSHDLVGAPAVWDGATGAGLATQGEGVVVGMLDTGVNPDHPSFAATDGEGYTHTNPLGSGTYLGVCDPDHPQHDPMCNDKLIGAWSFHPFSGTARDLFDHGSHVGSTIAGNRHEVAYHGVTRTVQGVAPRANVISYQVCFPGCPETSTVAAVEQAIADPTGVLNYSISGPDNPWNDVVSLAFLDAYEAGIFVAASAGNDGPRAGTAAKTAPWNASVAATNHERVFAHPVAVTDPVAITGIAGVPGSGAQLAADLAAEVREAGLGCEPYPDGALAGTAALIARGECPYWMKVGNAAAAGAVAVVVTNDLPGPPSTMGQLGGSPIPAVMVAQDAGDTLRELLTDHAPDPVLLQIGADVQDFVDPDWAATVAEFSSRGPSRFAVLTPTLAAPGVAVLAAASPVDEDPQQYLVASGTSMAAPHVAGAGALLAALHPDWSPSRIQSALVGTADELPAGVFEVGAGRLNVAAAARTGLVLDETHANFLAANPGSGGDPRSLNVPSLVDHQCAASCSWTRTLTHAGAEPATYTATGAAPDGAAVTVSPTEFTLAPGASQTVRITLDLDPAAHPAGEWVAARFGFTTGASHPGGQPVAPVSYPVAVVAADPDDIALAAEAYRARGDFYAELTWQGATSDLVDIWRDGELLATVPADLRRYHDDLGKPRHGTTFTYQVCRVGSRAVCSAETDVEIGAGAGNRPNPRITTTALPDLNLLERYRHPLFATGGSGSYQWEATGLPTGLVLDPATGMLGHDPDVPAVTGVTGPVNVTVTVRDAAQPGQTDSATFTLGLVEVAELAAGWGHTCAVTTEGTAYCWGRDATGQIGRGVVGGDGIHVPLPTPVLAPDGSGPLTAVAQIAGGDGHTCALTTEGTVYCWGAAFDGRLGDGDPQLTPKPLPVQVRGPEAGHLTGVVEIAVGWQFGCAATDSGELFCWGNNANGKLGTGDDIGATVPVAKAVSNSDGTGPLIGVTTVAAGSGHACAMADGTAYCWGANFQGQLGVGETSFSEPLPLPVLDPPEGITQLAAGGSHTCATTEDGSAYCWGSNGSGQLGFGGTGGNIPVPVQVNGPDGTAPLTGVELITMDGNHTCALAGPDAAAYCWGANFQGQLGTGELDGPPQPLPVPVLAPDGDGPFPGATALTAGSSHTCALVAGSAGYCWGANVNWQLGIGETSEELREPLPVPIRPGW